MKLTKLENVGQATQMWCDQSDRPSTYSESMASTNSVAKSADLSEEMFHLVVTSHQSEGRGRGDNTWQDIDGSALLSSWVYLSENPLHAIHSPRIGLAVYRALSSSFPARDWSLKAPNDIYLDGKKVAGLLIEAETEGDQHRIIIGLGLNVFASPEGIENATSIYNSPDDATLFDWFSFLERMDLEFQLSLQSPPFDELATVECESIRHALNQNSSSKDQWDTVKSDGSLVSSSQTVSWREL